MFRDRAQAGRQLVQKLAPLCEKNAFVLGLARGGVVVGREVGHGLSLPLDVLVVKKISHPSNPELAVGALAPDGISLVDWRRIAYVGLDSHSLAARTKELEREIVQRTLAYRKGKKPLVVKEKTVILVDDGAATGLTMEVAIKWCKAKHARRIVAAVPVAHPDIVKKITPECDAFVVLDTPQTFESVGQFYTEFPQVSDEEVIQLLSTKH